VLLGAVDVVLSIGAAAAVVVLLSVAVLLSVVGLVCDDAIGVVSVVLASAVAVSLAIGVVSWATMSWCAQLARPRPSATAAAAVAIRRVFKVFMVNPFGIGRDG